MCTFREWGLPLTQMGVWVTAPSRARSVVDDWARRQWPALGRRTRRERVASQGLPPGRSWETLARDDRIPTLMSSYDQHICLIRRGFNRVMSVAEVLAAAVKREVPRFAFYGRVAMARLSSRSSRVRSD